MEKQKSYWTKRRKIRKVVAAHMKEIADSVLAPVNSSCFSTSTESDIAGQLTVQNVEMEAIGDESDDTSEGVTSLAADLSSITGCMSSGCNELQHAVSDPDSDAVFSTDDELELEVDLPEKLAEWAKQFKIPMNATSALLAILHDDHPNLPKDARTLLATQVYTDIKIVAGGEYYHFGVEPGLVAYVRSTPDASETVSVQINIDGLPIFKSTGAQLWPILGMVENQCRKSPFVIGIFCGDSKPTSAAEFLKQFVDECYELQSQGFIVDDVHHSFRISAIICDAPAKAFVKGVKLYGGYHGCDKCKQHGVWLGKVTYPETNAELRSDEDFKTDSHVDNQHIKTVSPLSHLAIGMVSQFPIDYMHQCCLGIMKRILHLLTKGPLSVRLSPRAVSSISEWMVSIRGFTPRELARKPRSLRELGRWKATELRFFMLYAGPVILKSHVPKPFYDNFVLFCVVMHIFLSPVLCHAMTDYAEQLSIAFVKHFGEIYGSENLVYNIHSLTHLAGDVRMYGILDNVSSFPFENYLGQIKRLVRKPSSPLQQVVRRLSELSHHNVDRNVFQADCPRKQHHDGPVPGHLFGSNQYKELVTKNMFISVEPGDNCVNIDGHVCCIQNILLKTTELFVVYVRFHSVHNLFDYPCPSSQLGIRIVADLSDSIHVTPLSGIQGKNVLLPYKGDQSVALALLHTVS